MTQDIFNTNAAIPDIFPTEKELELVPDTDNSNPGFGVDLLKLEQPTEIAVSAIADATFSVLAEPEAIDGDIVGFDSIEDDTVGDPLLDGGATAQLVEAATQEARSLLAQFASRDDVAQALATAFGTATDGEAVADLLADWSTGDRADFPAIEVLTGGELGQALGAFSVETQTIYLSSEFLAASQGNVAPVTNVLLEEFGHWVDSQVNVEDAPGDEGAIFSALVRGEVLSGDELAAFKAEDDSRLLELDNQLTFVEQAIIERTGGFEGDSQTIQLDSSDGGSIDLSYQMYEVRDQIELRYAGETVFDSGLTSGGRSVRIDLPEGKNSDRLEVILTPNQNIDTTRWVYRINTSSADIYPLRADGDFQEVGNNTFQANGVIQIGLADGPFPLVTLEGSANYDNLKFTADGKITPSIGNIQLPVWQEGSFTIDIGEQITNALNDSANSELNELGIAGFDIQFSQLAFTDRGIELEGVIDFPDGIGIADISVSGDNKILIDDTGIGITGAGINIDDFSFMLADILEFQASDLSLDYVHLPEEERGIQLQGKASIPSFFNVTADFAGENYIKLNNNADPRFDVTGSISAEDIPIVKNVWEIKSAKLSVNSQEKSILGEASLLIPTGIIVDGSLGFVDGRFDSAGLFAGFNEAGQPLNKPIGATGAVLQGIGGEVKNLASEPKDDDEFGGRLRVTAGPQVTVRLPSWAGGTFSGSAADFDVSGSLNIKEIGASGDIKFFGGAIAGTTDLSLNFDRKTLAANANFSALGGLIDFNGSLKANSQFDFDIVADASVRVPSVIPLIGEKQLGQGVAQVAFSNDENLSNDFVAGWGTINVPFKGEITKGFKLFLDGDSEIPETNSFIVEDGTEYLVMGADWEIPNDNVGVQVISPDGSVFAPQDFPEDKIALIDDLASDTTVAVIVNNPEAGVWDIRLSNEAQLGNIEYTAFRDSEAPNVSITSPSTDVSGSSVEIGYEAFDSDSEASLSFFYDTDNTGFDGFLIEGDVPEVDSAGSFTWELQGVPTGEYYVYAVATDENNAPVRSNYSAGKILVSDAADLSIDQVANLQSVEPGQDITYTVTVVNNGSSIADGVTVTSELPESTTFVSSTLDSQNLDDNEILFNIGNLAVGESVTFDFVLKADITGVVDSISRVNSNTFDPVSSNDVAVVSSDVEMPEIAQNLVDLGVTVQAPESVSLGDSIDYQLIVTNNGISPATGVEMTSILPLGTSFASAESTQGETSVESNVKITDTTSPNVFDDLPTQRTDERILSNLGTLNPGESAIVSVATNSFSSGSLVNSVRVTSNETDVDLSNNSIRKSVVVNSTQPEPTDLELTQFVNESGNQAVLTLSVSNVGDAIASGIEVSNPVPSGGTIVASTPSQGEYDPNTGIWKVGNLRNGVNATLNLAIAASEPGLITNTAEITAMSELDIDSTPGNGDPNEDDFSTLAFDSTGVALAGLSPEYRKFLEIYGLI